jgi:hypothetical protein
LSCWGSFAGFGAPVVSVVADCCTDVAVDGLVGAVAAGHFVAAFDAGEVGGGHASHSPVIRSTNAT